MAEGRRPPLEAARALFVARLQRRSERPRPDHGRKRAL